MRADKAQKAYDEAKAKTDQAGQTVEALEKRLTWL